MKEEIVFQIQRTGKKPAPVGPELAPAAFDGVVGLALEKKLCPKYYPGSPSLSIKCDINHPALPELLERLRSYGWEANAGMVEPGNRERYNLRIVRRYDQNDIDCADLLYREAFDIFGFGKWNGYEWVGEVEKVEDWDAPLVSFGMFNYFVRSHVKEGLERSRLKGLSFKELKWNVPGQVATSYWKIEADVMMPECLLPRKWLGNPGIAFEEGGYRPAELKFKRKEVEALGKFDVAYTRESVGDPKLDAAANRILIFSHNFREALDRMKVDKNLDYKIVRLVD